MTDAARESVSAALEQDRVESHLNPPASYDLADHPMPVGREEIWPLHRRTAELGGNLRTGLEDTFYLPSGEKATSNGQLVEALVDIARACGREIASPTEARAILGIGA